MKTMFFSDRERLEFLTSKITQEWVDYMHQRLSHDGRIRGLDDDIIGDHLDVTMNIVSLQQFSDPEIKAAYEMFNKRTEELFVFIQDHFSQVFPSDLKPGENPPEYLALYPRHRRSSNHEERQFYELWQSKMQKVGTSFGRAYYDLILLGSKNLSQDQDTQSLAKVSTRPSIAGRTLFLEHGSSVILTQSEVKLLECLMAEPPQVSTTAYAYPRARTVSLLKIFDTPRSFQGVRSRLLEKSVIEGVKVFDIAKGYERKKNRTKLSGYELTIFRTQNLGNLV